MSLDYYWEIAFSTLTFECRRKLGLEGVQWQMLCIPGQKIN